jgi:hypothetical protein
MDRLSFRARSLFTSFLLTGPAVWAAGACSSASTAPPEMMGTFPDASMPGVDATMKKKPPPKKDGGHEGKKDAAEDAKKGDAKAGDAKAGDAKASDAKAGDAKKSDAKTTDAKAADAKSDALVDAAPDAPLPGDAATNAPCTSPVQCASHVCAEMTVVVNDAGVAHDAGNCLDHTCVCQASSCTDGVKNGMETDVDCGGNCPRKCVDGEMCLVGSDCVAGVCGGVPNQDGGAGATCQPPSCTDGVKNGTETDVDCGSSGKCPPGETCQTCPGCTTGEACTMGGDCTSTICNGSTCSCPTGMQEVVASPPYCIDTYEVTFAQYQTFLDLGVDVTKQSDECKAWNTTFEPQGLGFIPGPGDPSINNPVTNVNWCDAVAYCEHTQNKHLCGTIATAKGTSGGSAVPGGGPVTYPPATGPADSSLPAVNNFYVDEWYNGCSGQGNDVYPYGTTYHPGICNGIDAPSQATTGFVDSPPGTAGNYITDGDGGVGPICILDEVCNNPRDDYRTVRASQIVNCHVGSLLQCTPASCASLNANCGVQSDGCGNMLPSCGTCTAPETCGGGGQPNRCGASDGGTCVPATCASLNVNCGNFADGCGGTTGNCGSCTAPQTCGGGGVAGVCGLKVVNPTCGAAFAENDGCQNGAGLWDMSGNVAEWENSCSATTSGSGGQNDTCVVRGGSFDSPNGSTSLACAWSASQMPVARGTTANDIGFRCCL